MEYYKTAFLEYIRSQKDSYVYIWEIQNIFEVDLKFAYKILDELVKDGLIINEFGRWCLNENK